MVMECSPSTLFGRARSFPMDLTRLFFLTPNILQAILVDSSQISEIFSAADLFRLEGSEVMQVIVDPRAQTFGLPSSLRVPIAAAGPGEIERYAGSIVASKVSRQGRLNAVKVQTRMPAPTFCDAPLWQEPEAPVYRDLLFPPFQLWVHVDYRAYRQAWLRLGFPPLHPDLVLDHLANRKATRIRGYLHPFIRLAPIPSIVNTNAGHEQGAEGMERAYMRSVLALPEPARTEKLEKMRSDIVLS
jgi:hypothetical protein